MMVSNMVFSFYDLSLVCHRGIVSNDYGQSIHFSRNDTPKQGLLNSLALDFLMVVISVYDVHFWFA